MAVGALDPTFSRSFYSELINELNQLIAIGTITAGNTVTQTLTDLATERDKH